VFKLVAYVAFVGLHGLLQYKIDSPRLYDAFYITGSVCFIIASVAYIIATIPKSYFSKESTFFYGSWAFLVGSIFYILDSFKMDGPWFVPLGNANIFAARVLFLIGSTSFDISCNGPKCFKHDVCSCCCESGVKVSADKNERLIQSPTFTCNENS